MKLYGFIYLTTNLCNGKRYIGQTKRSATSTYFGSGKAIRKALKKYGAKNFTREILVYAFSKKDLDFLEEHFIKEFNATDDRDWYNISPAPNVTSGFAGKKQSDKQKAIAAEFGRTRPATERMRENASRVGKLPRTKTQSDASKLKAKRMGDANAQPVVVNGIQYSSKTAACKALNIYPEKLRKLLAS
jgi:group I intron endonuclease